MYAHTTVILDPYAEALKRNYYFPLEPHIYEMSPESNDTSSSPVTAPSSPKSTTTNSSAPSIITVEHSLATISDLLKEMEADDLPSQTPIETPILTAPIKSASYHHRFAIYCRRNAPYITITPATQLTLFKSFVKCIKSIDNSAQLLPIRNDLNIHPISHSDQITHMESAGTTHYIKPYN
jgi:hypothetical protein